ncbi:MULTISPECIES: oligogalacturonate-specific porin KdgM family protein [Vibrio]|uniref:oligogalacturonate-specific porin KdgM family protein n=1 Tax=Vibrio TaxID=662 RepID=UPI00056DD216|nr:oligogalacturonate-specific porin KdgM family protein [Vibrio pacinii]
MKKLFALTALASVIAAPAMANEFDENVQLTEKSTAKNTYVTGNIQFHDDGRIHGTDASSTLEVGHTFTNGLGGATIYAEFDGLQMGNIVNEPGSAGQFSPFLTIGGEQRFTITDNFWVGAGYQHLLQNGDTVQYRPLVKIGYDMDNGFSWANRFRAHLPEDSKADNDYRLDTTFAYQLQDTPLRVSYNNVYMTESDLMDHELRLTWTRNGNFQPYVEYRSQANGLDLTDASYPDQTFDGQNNALVIGGTFVF